MKKLPLILSIVSVIAVAILFVLEFTEKDENSDSRVEPGVEMSTAAGIPFVEVDSLIYNFEFYFDMRDELQVKQQAAESELNSKGRKYETGAKDYEDKVRKGLVTRATAAEMEQNLLQQQQDLVNLRDQLQYDLMEEEQVMNRKVLEYIYSFLDEYASEQNYQYVLGKSFGGQIMYSESSLDITADVLKKLNLKYLSGKK
jgi:outer membrane protein